MLKKEKKYSIFDLCVVGVEKNNGTHQYYICEDNHYEYFKEVLTGMTIDKCNCSSEPLCSWVLSPMVYARLRGVKYSKPMPNMKLGLEEILNKCLEINHINFLLENDEESIQEVLTNRGLFEESQIYKKRVRNIND